MNNKLGCSGVFVLLLIFAGIANLMQSAAGWFVLAVIVLLIVISVRLTTRKKQQNFVNGLAQQATTLSLVAEGKLPDANLAITLKKGEVVLGTIPNVLLTEYQSTGSSYSGASAGVSFPLFGNVRGNVGGQGGQITKNPEQLTAVDTGLSIYTNQRIVFSGAKFVRDWDFSKVVNLETGPNGFSVKIAVSDQSRTSGLQSPDINFFGPGYLAAYAFNYFQEGEAYAKKWANDLVNQIRGIVAVEQAKLDK